VQHDTGCAGRRSSDHDMVGVATKLRKIFLHPLEGLALVLEPVVGRDVLSVAEKAVRPDSVVGRHEDN